MEKNKYCESLNQYIRFKSREVKIGNIALGANNPIRIQSMTNTDTLNTEASVEQCKRIFDAGGDYVRLTTQAGKHAENLANIKAKLITDNYTKPLIADVHFNPKAAEIAAKHIEKVRVNPGNFAELKANKLESHSYQESLNHIEKRFTKLIEICKAHNTAIRIGSNHGSLSQRIVDKYGDTAEGMVQSVIEYLDIARKNDFHRIVISLKSSNTRVMVYAYRLLINRMMQKGMNYPTHLGVTEAGDGEDGRIKSAIGISTLLYDGIGDTVRVSLTEAPEKEIPVAKAIVENFDSLKSHAAINGIENLSKNPFDYSKRKTYNNYTIGSKQKAVVIANLSFKEVINISTIENLAYRLINNEWNSSDNSPDFIFIGNAQLDLLITDGLQIICHIDKWDNQRNTFPYFTDVEQYKMAQKKSDKINFIELRNQANLLSKLLEIKEDKTVVLLLNSNNKNVIADKRAFIQHLDNNSLKFPVVSRSDYTIDDRESFQIKAACDMGLLLIDGLIDGIMLSKLNEQNNSYVVGTAFAILQASRTRMSKTEYISCPSCGRTLFEIEKVTAQIKKRTNHLKGLKIAVMGCIVNGPGEMADADYGYVGAGTGKVSLYKGKKVMKNNIQSHEALDALINLIKDNGDWKEANLIIT